MPDDSNPMALTEQLNAVPVPRSSNGGPADRCSDCTRDISGLFVTTLATDSNGAPLLQVCDNCLASGRWASWMRQPWPAVAIEADARRMRHA
jgi:hypothetical protein